jgi:hypothetical protein
VLEPDTGSPADLVPDVSPEPGRDGPIELGQPERYTYPDGVPAIYETGRQVDVGREAGLEVASEAGQPDRFEVRIVDGGPAIFDLKPASDAIDASPDRPDAGQTVDVDQSAVDTGSESGAK